MKSLELSLTNCVILKHVKAFLTSSHNHCFWAKPCKLSNIYIYIYIYIYSYQLYIIKWVFQDVHYTKQMRQIFLLTLRTTKVKYGIQFKNGSVYWVYMKQDTGTYSSLFFCLCCFQKLEICAHFISKTVVPTNG